MNMTGNYLGNSGFFNEIPCSLASYMEIEVCMFLFYYCI